MLHRRSLCGYGASFQNFHYGRHGCIDFGVGVVEVRGEADSGFGTPVHEDVAGEEFPAHLLGIGHVDGDGAAAPLGIAGSVDAPPVLVGELDKAGGLAFGFLADVLYTYFANDRDAGTRRLDRGDVRGSVHESVWRIGIADGSGCELKRIFVLEPSGELRLQFFAKVGADVEIRHAGTAAEPLENASAGEIGVERLDVDGDGTERLKSVEDDVSANFVRFVDDGLGIVDIRAAKNNVRDGDDQSPLVDGIEQAIG